MNIGKIQNTNFNVFKIPNAKQKSELTLKLAKENSNDLQYCLNLIKEQNKNPNNINLGVSADSIYAETASDGKKFVYNPQKQTIVKFFKSIISKMNIRSRVKYKDFGYRNYHLSPREVEKKLDYALS